MLSALLEKAGYTAVSGHIDDVRRGKLDLLNFVRQHEPRVIIYDLVPPYDRSWNFLATVRGSRHMRGRTFVLTSLNARRASDVVGRAEMVYEIIGKDEDLGKIVTAVKEALHKR